MYVHVYTQVYVCMLYFFPHILYHSATCLFKLVGRSINLSMLRHKKIIELQLKVSQVFLSDGMEKSVNFWPTNTIFCNCCGLCNNVNILQCVYLAILLVEQGLVQFDFSLLSIMLQ